MTKKLRSIPPGIRGQGKMGNENLLEKLEKIARGNPEAEKRIEELKKRLGENGGETLSELLNLGELGKLFEGIGNLVDLAAKLRESGLNEGTKEFDLGNGRKGVISHGIRIGPMARPGTGKTEQFKVETFGNKIHRTEKGLVVEDVREPEVDVFEEEEGVVIVGDLPGIEEGDIKCEIQARTLKIETFGRRKYQKEISISFEPDPETLRKSYKNGVLEIKLRRLQQTKKGD